MEQNDFYEVDGCMDFIPVKLIEEHKHMTNTLRVELTETGDRAFVPHMYSFPKVTEPQKVVVPKFVAEWIEEAKKIHNNLSWVWFSNPVSDELNEWLKNHTETFMRAWLDGYTVEKEKLYTVEIPDQNSLYKHRFLSRNGNGVCIDASNDIGWKQRRENRLTESEIKKDFDFLWQFAKGVE